MAENAFLSVYKLLAEAPDPFPLLDAAVVRPAVVFVPVSRHIDRSQQDQTARASEAKVLEMELARSKDEIASLKQQLVESQSVEKEKKKLADKVERLEAKVRFTWRVWDRPPRLTVLDGADGRHDPRPGLVEGGRATCDVRRAIAKLRGTVRPAENPLRFEATD